jgi:hypothetical protein
MCVCAPEKARSLTLPPTQPHLHADMRQEHAADPPEHGDGTAGPLARKHRCSSSTVPCVHCFLQARIAFGPRGCFGPAACFVCTWNRLSTSPLLCHCRDFCVFVYVCVCVCMYVCVCVSFFIPPSCFSLSLVCPSCSLTFQAARFRRLVGLYQAYLSAHVLGCAKIDSHAVSVLTVLSLLFQANEVSPDGKCQIRNTCLGHRSLCWRCAQIATSTLTQARTNTYSHTHTHTLTHSLTNTPARAPDGCPAA